MITRRFSIEFGRFARRALARGLREGAQSYDVDVSIDYEMGLLFGTMFVKVTGQKEKVEAYCNSVDQWINTFPGRK